MSVTADRPLCQHMKELRIRAGLSLDEVAAGGGYKGRSSVQRYFEDTNLEVIALRAARRLAKALYGRGSPPIDVQDLAWMVFKQPSLDDVGLAAAAKLLNIYAIDNVSPSGVRPVKSGMLPVLGAAQASNWMEKSPAFDEVAEWLTVPFQRFQPQPDQYALRIVGPALNKIAPDGHFAICQKYDADTKSLPNDKFVHAERQRGGFVEWSVRRVQWEAEGMSLWPFSDHPDHAAPLDLSEDGVVVRILGLVTGWYRPA